ncbi:Bifunctional NAD(P)H-hydrate repair enzyme Nnr [Methanimicrococcus stummii]|uniref:Bifunctional NAD(P)H-hydrate repair enzyme n=1 Tax=Methanimicrococcus stummii TaxID=3028294 RepID=A0AA96VKP0_9EURY|nr:NAD(P)H-hydrate dehydratase [Methanimicrococcus sp. Es2]WNY28112.1 Bifunctional NAD(P)H-hydrate repair enzyme Nnr [Methanimicrococcus sp. Es2]
MRQNIITADEMKAIDKNAAGLGMNPLQLMENAGAAAAEIIFKFYTEKPDSVRAPILFFAGHGNNGGDIFVAARHLANLNVPSIVFLLGTESQIKTPESQTNFKLLKQTNFISVFEIKSESALSEVFNSLENRPKMIVDGIFGTGFSGSVKGLEKAAIGLINAEKAARNIPVLAIDIPSGMPPADLSDSVDSKSNVSFSNIVKADATITFHKEKTFLKPEIAEKYAGEVFVCPIGIPENAEKFIGPGDVSLLFRRASDSKKGDSGKVLVIAGGPYSGAPALAGMGALRTGVDIATIAAPQSIYKVVASFAPEFIVRKLSGDIFSENDISPVSELIRPHDVVVLGPGFGRAPESAKAAAQLIPLLKKAVIDADALVPEIFEAIVLKQKSDAPAEIVITPHYHEFLRTAAYFKINLPKDRADSNIDKTEAAALKISQTLGAVVLLKGQNDLIANGDEIRYNSTGNAGMSVGGTGDVLAGAVGGLLAKNSAVKAAECGAYICGKAGDLAYADFGYSLLPTDLISKIPAVLFPEILEKAALNEINSKSKKSKRGKNKNRNKKRGKKRS